MKKIFTLTAFASLLFHLTYAQELSKEEKKRLKAEIKNYLSDLAGYQAKMQDIRTTLDSNDAEIKRLKDDVAFASSLQAELENKVADYDIELKRCYEDKSVYYKNPLMQGDTTRYKEGKSAKNVVSQYSIYDPNDAAYASDNADMSSGDKKGSGKSASSSSGKNSATKDMNSAVGGNSSSTGNSGDTGNSGNTGNMASTSSAGTTYKVQIGLFRDFNINKYFDQPRFIGFETAEGMNRYIIGSFTDESMATSFTGDMRKMGIRDAFVAKYVDGKRVYEWEKNEKYKGKKAPSSLKEAVEQDKSKH